MSLIKNIANRFFIDSFLTKALSLLSHRNRITLTYILIVQIILNFLDLLGVVAIGALGALSIQGIETKMPGNKVGFLLRLLHIENMNFQIQVAILGTLAAILLLTKTITSVIFTRKTFFFLSNQSAIVSTKLVSKILSQNLLGLQSRTSQETLFIVTDGVKSLFLDVLATRITIAADLSLLFIISFGLLIIDPFIASITILVFLLIGYLLHRLLQRRAVELGEENRTLRIQSNEKILEVLNSYRESVVRNRRGFYAVEIGKLRHKLADVTAEYSFMPYISKYIIESTVVIGTLLLSGFEFGSKNSAHAIGVLAVFMAASSRIAPAALRIQQGHIIIKQGAGAAKTTVALLDELVNVGPLPEEQVDFDFNYPDFLPSVVIEKVYFKYPDGSKFSLKGISMDIPAGSSTAIVGASGAGKTTLIDLILGVLTPDVGKILISNVPPSQASLKWPGAISYVPQNITVSSGTIRQNISLGYPDKIAGDNFVEEALLLSQLATQVELTSSLLDRDVGEGGSKISGGQRQRLGIARALFTKPKLLVLDEATSSLDGRTEAELTSAIKTLRGKVTVIVVAHRLSTVREVDKVIYMENGSIRAVGTFSEVRSQVPDFDAQAKLMGL